MGRHPSPDVDDPEVIDRGIRAYLETGSKRAGGRAAFPSAHPDNAARRFSALLEQPAVVERLKELAGEEDAALVPHGEPARRRVRRDLWTIKSRCMQDEPDTGPAATSRAATLRAELRARHTIVCCHEPPGIGCASCEQNRDALEAILVHVGAFRFDARNALFALEQLGKIEGMFVDRKLLGRMSEGDEMLAGLSSHEIARTIFVIAVREWGGDFCHALVDELAGTAAPLALPEPDDPTIQ